MLIEKQMFTIREVARMEVLPETALRRLVKDGRCPGVFVGTKFLVNLPQLVEFLNHSTSGDSREASHE